MAGHSHVVLWVAQSAQPAKAPYFTVTSCYLHLVPPCRASAESSTGRPLQTCEISFWLYQLFSSAAHLLVQTAVCQVKLSFWPPSQDLC